MAKIIIMHETAEYAYKLAKDEKKRYMNEFVMKYNKGKTCLIEGHINYSIISE